jgi:hypothetical protein
MYVFPPFGDTIRQLTHPPPDLPATPTSILVLILLRLFPTLNPLPHAQLLRPLLLPFFALAFRILRFVHLGLVKVVWEWGCEPVSGV